MILGEFSPELFFKIASYLVLSSLFIIYWISQYLGHEKPFPDPSISSCAGHYPEYVFFRVSTISGSALFVLGWLTNNFWLKTIARESTYNIRKIYPEIGMVMGMMSGLFLMGSTANIDTGKRDGVWHQHCAAAFFVFISLAIFYNTFVYYSVYKNTNKISKFSMGVKAIIVVSMIIQGYISAEYGSYSWSYGTPLDSIGNLIEWTYAITVMLYCYFLALDMKGFKFIY